MRWAPIRDVGRLVFTCPLCQHLSSALGGRPTLPPSAIATLGTSPAEAGAENGGLTLASRFFIRSIVKSGIIFYVWADA